jgi:hypothetical protein
MPVTDARESQMASPASALAGFTERWLKAEPALHYSLIFCPKGQRTHWLVCAVLALELLEAAFALSDMRIAAIKLAWWHEELELTKSGAARHPLTQALDVLGSDVNDLTDSVFALQKYLDSASMATQADQLRALASFSAGIAQLCLSGPMHSLRSPLRLQHVRDSWACLALLYQLQALRLPDRFGPCALPLPVLAKAQLTRSALHTEVADAHVWAMRDALSKPSLRPDQAGIPALGAMLALYQRAVRAKAPSGFRALFIAWRGARWA